MIASGLKLSSPHAGPYYFTVPCVKYPNTIWKSSFSMGCESRKIIFSSAQMRSTVLYSKRNYLLYHDHDGWKAFSKHGYLSPLPNTLSSNLVSHTHMMSRQNLPSTVVSASAYHILRTLTETFVWWGVDRCRTSIFELLYVTHTAPRRQPNYMFETGVKWLILLYTLICSRCEIRQRHQLSLPVPIGSTLRPRPRAAASEVN
jgi:hypothetical protein